MYYRLFLMTFQLFLLPNFFFAAINAFHDSAVNKISAINIVIACFMMALLVLFTLKLGKETMKLTD